MRFNTQDGEAMRRWHGGISVYDDLERAIVLARDGGFAGVATLAVSEDSVREFSQYGRDKHHFTMFGNSEELMALVTDFIPLSGPSGD